jgi:hypothetical protein
MHVLSSRSALLLALPALLAACGASSAQTAAEVPPIPLLTVQGALGGECLRDGDCATGFCDRTVPGGVCTAHCASGAECGEGGVCFEGYCQQRCQSQRQCRSADFDCYALPESDVGICAYNISLAPTEPNIGAECRASIECAAPGELEAFCMAEYGRGGVQTPFVGGMCLAAGCVDNADCGDGAVCVGAENMRVCMPACSDASACRAGYDCIEGACAPAR